MPNTNTTQMTVTRYLMLELAVEEKKDDKPMDMHSLVSQPHSPVKSAREGVKLEKMPDYFNPLTKEKL